VSISIIVLVSYYTDSMKEYVENAVYSIVISVTFDLLYYLMFSYNYLFRDKIDVIGFPGFIRAFLMLITVALTIYKAFVFIVLVKELSATKDSESNEPVNNPYLN